MYTKHNINNSRFSVRFCTIAKYLNFKKIGGFEKLLKQMPADNKLAIPGSAVRVSNLLREIEEYKRNCGVK